MEERYYSSISEAKNELFSRLSDEFDFKFLKSSNQLKKNLGNLVFEITFFSSKWNAVDEMIEINAFFRLINKKYGKLPVNNVVASFEFLPVGQWYKITTSKQLETAYLKISSIFTESIVPLFKRFEDDYNKAVEFLFYNKFEEYHVHLDFASEVIEESKIIQKAQTIYSKLNSNQKEQIVDYRNGKRDKSWMINRGNLKYIVDKNYV